MKLQKTVPLWHSSPHFAFCMPLQMFQCILQHNYTQTLTLNGSKQISTQRILSNNRIFYNLGQSEVRNHLAMSLASGHRRPADNTTHSDTERSLYTEHRWPFNHNKVGLSTLKDGLFLSHGAYMGTLELIKYDKEAFILEQRWLAAQNDWLYV